MSVEIKDEHLSAVHFAISTRIIAERRLVAESVDARNAAAEYFHRDRLDSLKAARSSLEAQIEALPDRAQRHKWYRP